MTSYGEIASIVRRVVEPYRACTFRAREADVLFCATAHGGGQGDVLYST